MVMSHLNQVDIFISIKTMETTVSSTLNDYYTIDGSTDKLHLIIKKKYDAVTITLQPILSLLVLNY